MKVLLVEDNEVKAASISELIKSIAPEGIINQVSCVTDMVKLLESEAFDLIILDFMLPLTKDGLSRDVSIEIANIVRDSTLNQSADIVAITAFPELIEKASALLALVGVIVCEYSGDSDNWRLTMSSLIRKCAAKSTRRFVIICALPKERDAFEGIASDMRPAASVRGLDVCDLTINGILGTIVLCPGMGLVNSSIVSTLAIERFSPEVVCMAGICAGVSDSTDIGQLIIGNPCFEYQVGKYSTTGFEIEPYQCQLDEELRQALSLVAGNKELNEDLYADLENESIQPSSTAIKPFVSGSAVVAEKSKMEEILTQHRKISGLDMEAVGVLRAGQLTNKNIKTFVAKAVVDFADDNKGDQYQSDGCKISARFCANAITQLFS